MPKHDITFAKIFAPPSATAWSQIYHAGNVYTVVSVTQTEEPSGGPEHAIPSVHVAGKDIINNLEAEYFAMPTKTFESMKEAVANACKEIPETVAATVIFSVLQQDLLYLFIYGQGHVYIKRNDKFGTLLESPKGNKQVIAVSGRIQPNDIITLATDQFIHAFPQTQLKEKVSLSPSELSEMLSPTLDDEKFAGAAAIILKREGEIQENVIASETKQSTAEIYSEQEQTQSPLSEKIDDNDKQEEKQSVPVTIKTIEEKSEEDKTLADALAEEEKDKIDLDEKPQFAIAREMDKPIKIDNPKPEEKYEEPQQTKKKRRPSAMQLFFLLLAITLAGVLGTSIFVTQHKQQNTEAQTFFASEFPSAKQKYDEGQSLLSLNKNLAQDDFQKAKTILEGLKTKLPSDSPDLAQVNTLLDKVNQALGPTETTQSTSLKQADNSASTLLAAEIANPSVTYFAQDDKTVYGVDSNNINSFSSSNKPTSVVKNDSDWSTLGGFGAYLGNFYILDKKANQILKFTKGSDGYGKSHYFSDTPPTISNAAAITIDGSIWILTNDGTIKKFTKGKQDAFNVNKLTKQFSQPTRIFTNADMDNVYVLDNGNTRVVVIKKDTGDVVNEYGATEIKNAKDLDVDEKNKKIYLLINAKISEIDM